MNDFFLVLAMSRILTCRVLARLCFLKNMHMLVHAARGDYLAEFWVSPRDAPYGSVVPTGDLEGAYPLVSQHHFVCDLLSYLFARRIHRTGVKGRVSEVEICRSLPHFYHLVATAGRDTTAIVIKLDIVDEVIVLEREAGQGDTAFLFLLALRLLL